MRNKTYNKTNRGRRLKSGAAHLRRYASQLEHQVLNLTYVIVLSTDEL
jgi:hypothetical protein